MNNKKFIPLFFVLVLALLLVTKTAFAEGFPTISTACESKVGLLFAADDGFSLLKTCPQGSRRVVLVGEKGEKGDKGDIGLQGVSGPQGPAGANGQDGAVGPQGPEGPAGQTGPQGQQGIQGIQGPTGPQGLAGITGAGNVAFLNRDAGSFPCVLTTDKKIWCLNPSAGWQDQNMDVPLQTSQIVQWEFKSFLDSSGNVWNFVSSWINHGHP